LVTNEFSWRDIWPAFGPRYQLTSPDDGIVAEP
jgi:hypothetical protein